MIFVGDIAIPSSIKPKLCKLPDQFNNQIVVANLEGLIVAPDMSMLFDTKLFSNDNVIEFLKSCNIKAITLANNHVTDVSEAFDRTKALLDENGVKYCGAGLTLEEAQAPVVVEDDGIQYALLAFGWDVISCKYVSGGILGVNPLTTDNVLKCIRRTRDMYPLARIIILPHWDYELERYPMPMHRTLAKVAIDAGAFAVIGHHPHCVQGVEIYKNRLIAYSLGNFFIPDGVYMNGRTFFPQYAKEELAVEILGEEVKFHKFIYSPESHALLYCGDMIEQGIPEIQELSSFLNMSSENYVQWFRTNRVKKRLLPVFHHPDKSINTKIKGYFVKIRQRIINYLFAHGIKERTTGDSIK